MMEDDSMLVIAAVGRISRWFFGRKHKHVTVFSTGVSTEEATRKAKAKLKGCYPKAHFVGIFTKIA